MKELNPALDALATELAGEQVWAEVLIQQTGDDRFELRHARDRGVSVEALTRRDVAHLRDLAAATANGEFRPLKSAPNLIRGWVCEAVGVAELGVALDHLYPGAIADWFAARSAQPPIIDYRDYTGRQTGMYRITQNLTDAQAAQVTAACCAGRFCLKRRLWTVPGLEPDAVGAKSVIPCLEPCALLLEFARKAQRIEQSEPVTLPGEDLQAMLIVLKSAGEKLSHGGREADFSTPLNPRRMALLQLKLEALARKPDGEDV